MIKPPKDLTIAIDRYRSFWASLSSVKDNSYYDAVSFDGSVRDISALGYCDYECGHPGDDDDSLYYYASLIWAQAIVKNTEFHWGGEINNQYYIEYAMDDSPKCIFFPLQRLLEVSRSSYSQFDDFASLTDMLANHALSSELRIKDIKGLIRICVNQEYSSFHRSTHTVFKESATILDRLQHYTNNKKVQEYYNSIR